MKLIFPVVILFAFNVPVLMFVLYIFSMVAPEALTEPAEISDPTSVPALIIPLNCIFEPVIEVAYKVAMVAPEAPTEPAEKSDPTSVPVLIVPLN